MLRYICNDCGFETGNLDTYLIYRKDAKIIEHPMLIILYYIKSTNIHI